MTQIMHAKLSPVGDTCSSSSRNQHCRQDSSELTSTHKCFRQVSQNMRSLCFKELPLGRTVHLCGCEGKAFRQVDCVAMRNPLGPTLTVVLWGMNEHKFVNTNLKSFPFLNRADNMFNPLRLSHLSGEDDFISFVRIPTIFLVLTNKKRGSRLPSLHNLLTRRPNRPLQSSR